MIELLVVVSIISLLVAVLLPALAGARAQAQAVACGSQLKQISLALMTYALDSGRFPHGFDDVSRGFTPPPGGFLGDATRDNQGWWWFQSMRAGGVLDDDWRSLLTCPSRKLRQPAMVENILCGSYGANQAVLTSVRGRSFEHTGAALRPGRIARPAETLLLGDAGYALVSWWHAADKPPVNLGAGGIDTAYMPGLEINAGRTLRPGSELDALQGRHHGAGLNLAFADGHIRHAAASLVAVTASDVGYRNLTPLWLPLPAYSESQFLK